MSVFGAAAAISCLSSAHRRRQEWEQKGASERLSIYKNDLRTAENIGSVDYDAYLTRFEKRSA